jgi:hypothetical protein
VSTTAIFSVQQPIQNVTVSDFESASAQAAFEAAVAASMTGVLPSDVTITSVQASTRRLLLRTTDANSRMKAMGNSGVVVSYNVSFTTQGENVTAVHNMYSALSTQLAAAVSTGNFTTYLRQQSVVYNTTALASADATTVPTVSQPTVTGVHTPSPTHTPTVTAKSSNGHKHLSGGGVAGIVISVLFVVGAAAGYFYYVYRRDREVASTATRTAASSTPAIVNTENPASTRRLSAGASNVEAGQASKSDPSTGAGSQGSVPAVAGAKQASVSVPASSRETYDKGDVVFMENPARMALAARSGKSKQPQQPTGQDSI